MIQNDYKRYDGEDESDFILRICAMKDKIGTWQDVANLLNDALDYKYGESKYRKDYAQFVKVSQINEVKMADNDAYLQEMRDERFELEKARVKLRDERIDMQKSIREEARKESFIELIERVFRDTIEPFEYVPSSVSYTGPDMVVCISDMHTGIEVQNSFNTYNTTVLRRRLHQYLDEIDEIQNEQRCSTCYVVLGGDMISGLIHANLRLQNNENVIEQLKIAVIYLGEFINILKKKFNRVEVHSVAGNHSRLSPEKEEHLKGEELDAMIPFCLNLMFSQNPDVTIQEDNRIDDTIGSFTTTSGKLFYVVHGDKDSPKTAVENLTLMTGIKPDGIIMGHRHHNAFDTIHDVKIIQCGCVGGMDDYCVDKRISGSAEQVVFISTKERAVRCIYDIGLK